MAVEGGIGVDEGLRGVVLRVADEGGEFGSLFVFEADVYFVLMLQEVAGDEFFFTGVHGWMAVR